MAVPPVLAALRAFVHSAAQLDRAWHSDGAAAALDAHYPRGLPSFDDLLTDLITWRDGVARALGCAEGSGRAEGMSAAAALPAGWREGHQGDLACPHRDCSVCPECARREEVVEVYGYYFWIPDRGMREALRGHSGARARRRS